MCLCTKCCMAFMRRLRRASRIFHSSPSTAFAIISRYSLWFFLCYFSYCSDSRWKLLSHGKPVVGKYLISNIFFTGTRMKKSKTRAVQQQRTLVKWHDLKSNVAQVVEELTLDRGLSKNASWCFIFIICKMEEKGWNFLEKVEIRWGLSLMVLCITSGFTHVAG